MDRKVSYLKLRREGRILAFQSLFAYDFCNENIDKIIKFEWKENNIHKDSIEYANFLIKGTIDNLFIIDKIIKSKLENWDFERISYIDRAILRFSIFSILFEKDLDNKIVINEAIEIAKIFGTDDSYKFVNGILDAIKKSKEKS